MSLPEPVRLAQVQLELGLGTEGLQLYIEPGGVPADVNPWLLDVCAASIHELGHHDTAPRSFDWENLLPLLRPGEELLWIADYTRADPRGRDRVDLSIALRFTTPLEDPHDLEDRRTRFAAVLGHFRRQAFPESEVRAASPAETWAVLRGRDDPASSTYCVVGMPSPKDLGDDDHVAKREPERPVYQSLNDVIESCLHLDHFRITFVVGRASDAEVDRTLASVTDIHDRVRPFVEFQRATAHAEAESWMTQTTTAQSTTSSRPEADHLLNRIGRGIAQFVGGSRIDAGQVYRWENAPATRTAGETRSAADSQGSQKTQSETGTFTHVASALKLADKTLERYGNALYRARATGGYRGAVFVQADERDARLVAEAVRGVLSGSRSKDRPMTVSSVTGESRLLFTSNTPILASLGEALPILTDDQAALMLLLPEAELPGLRIHRTVFLGRNASPQETDGRRVRLGRFAFSSGLGSDVEIDGDDLFRHLLVCGTTGSGKTYRVLSILNDLDSLGDELRIVVFETAKRTYREGFHRKGAAAPRIYTVGNSAEAPLRVNPFYFEPGTSLKRHVSVLSDALSELMPTEALIGPKMREAVERCYLACGWDIESAAWRGDGEPRWPTTIAFVATLREVAGELKYGPEVNANYLGALEGRARVFLDATFQDIFSHGGQQPVEDLFDRDTIIELEGLPSSEIDMPAFLLSVLLERLRSHQARGSAVRWLIVVEEAHNVLPREREGERQSGEAQGGHTLLKNVVRLLQEGRELGIGLMIVDQAPTMLARAVVKNTNTKIVFRLEDGEEIAEMGQALGLDEAVWRDLGVLRQGEAVIKASYMSQPVKSARSAARDGPTRRAAREVRRTPDYRTLEQVWVEVWRGQEPDAAWADRLATAACGDGELARYGLGRALLRVWPTEIAAQCTDSLADFGTLPTSLAGLEALAVQLHERLEGQRLRRALLPLERRLLAAILRVPLPDERPGLVALEAAAELLAGRATDRALRRALMALASAPAGRVFAVGPLAELFGADPLGVVVQLHAVVARGDAAVVAALGAPAFSAIDLLAAIGGNVEALLDGLDGEGLRDGLTARVARVLVRLSVPERSTELEAWL